MKRKIPPPPVAAASAEPAVGNAAGQPAGSALEQQSNRFLRHSIHRQVHLLELVLPEQMTSEDFDLLMPRLLQLLQTDGGGRWLLDLSAAQHQGSATLGLVVNIRQQIQTSGGRLVLCGLSLRLRQIFHTCCLERLFTLCKGREEALRELGD